MIYTVEKHGVETRYTESEYVAYLQEHVRRLESEREWFVRELKSSNAAIAVMRANEKKYDKRLTRAVIELRSMADALRNSRDARDEVIAKHSDMVCDILEGKGEQSP